MKNSEALFMNYLSSYFTLRVRFDSSRQYYCLYLLKQT